MKGLTIYVHNPNQLHTIRLGEKPDSPSLFMLESDHVEIMFEGGSFVIDNTDTEILLRESGFKDAKWPNVLRILRKIPKPVELTVSKRGEWTVVRDAAEKTRYRTKDTVKAIGWVINHSEKRSPIIKVRH